MTLGLRTRARARTSRRTEEENIEPMHVGRRDRARALRVDKIKEQLAETRHRRLLLERSRKGPLCRGGELDEDAVREL